jgi:DNA modification methylase
MDNLELLKQIDDNSVDLIYCDILYNTGRNFEDYNDNLGSPQQAIEWYRPRLIEMKRVLKDTGTIYLQCDYRLVHYLKVEMDSIFRVNNFRNDIIWCYTSAGNYKKDFPKKHDNILRYTKSNNFIFNADSVRIPYKEESIKRASRKVIGVDRMKFNEIKLNEKGKIPEDWWVDINITSHYPYQNVGYDTQKPKKLLERIIKASSNKNDVVADFFVGSGTSLVVAKELGRKYIGCDINQRAVDITNKRLEDAEKLNSIP